MTEREQLFRRVTAQLEHWENVECFNHPTEIQINEANRLSRDRREAALLWAQELLEGRWLPIETAPKDGTTIDVWSGGEFSGRWTDVFWGKPDHECGEMGEYCDSDWHRTKPGWVDSTFQEFLHFKPTYWMPIPSGPETEAKMKRPKF